MVPVDNGCLIEAQRLTIHLIFVHGFGRLVRRLLNPTDKLLLFFTKIPAMRLSTNLFFLLPLIVFAGNLSAQEDKHQANVIILQQDTFNFPGEPFYWPVKNGRPGSGFVLWATDSTDDWLIVFHEWWGVDSYAKHRATDLWKDLDKKVNVLIVDLFDGRVTTTRGNASRVMQSLDRNRLIGIIDGVLDYLGKDKNIVVLGWGYGGGWALHTAIAGGEAVNGCVTYYGMPERDPQALLPLRARVLAIFGSRDTWINPRLAKDFEAAMHTAGKEVEMFTFDANQSFDNPDSKMYDPEVSAEAYAIVLAFLRTEFAEY